MFLTQPYTPKMVGPDEELIGIARLHWIYLVKGMIGFGCCILMGFGLNSLILMGMDALYTRFGSTSAGTLPLAMALNHYFMPMMYVCGALIFCIYLVKVLGTEVSLTSRRLIHKEGVLFITTHEVDIEEIRGERMDLGWFGRFLGYGFITLDCRFVADVTTPAIENPERFIRALHKLRSRAVDSIVTIAAHPDEDGVHRAHVSRTNMEDVAVMMADSSPEIPDTQPAQPIQPVAPPTQPPAPPTPPAAPPPSTPVPPEISPGPQEIPAEPQMPQSPPETARAAAALDPQMVADIVKQAMPQIVEKMTEEMAAKGLVVNTHQDNATPHPDADLLAEFDHASGEAQGEEKPRAFH